MTIGQRSWERQRHRQSLKREPISEAKPPSLGLIDEDVAKRASLEFTFRSEARSARPSASKKIEIGGVVRAPRCTAALCSQLFVNIPDPDVRAELHRQSGSESSARVCGDGFVKWEVVHRGAEPSMQASKSGQGSKIQMLEDKVEQLLRVAEVTHTSRRVHSDLPIVVE